MTSTSAGKLEHIVGEVQVIISIESLRPGLCRDKQTTSQTFVANVSLPKVFKCNFSQQIGSSLNFDCKVVIMYDN